MSPIICSQMISHGGLVIILFLFHHVKILLRTGMNRLPSAVPIPAPAPGPAEWERAASAADSVGADSPAVLPMCHTQKSTHALGPCTLPPMFPCASAPCPFRRLQYLTAQSQHPQGFHPQSLVTLLYYFIIPSPPSHFIDKETEAQKAKQIVSRPQLISGRPRQSPGVLALGLVIFLPHQQQDS